jgi:DNA-binding NarL/FixJ family response regulator
VLAREGILRILDALEGVEVVAVCDGFADLRAEIDRLDPDVVVTDVRLARGHGDEGVRLAQELRLTHPRTGVVVLGGHAETQYAMALFAGGSYRRAYLLKDELRDPSDLERAIREVAAGGALVDPAVVDELLSAKRPHDGSPLDDLTAREREILALVAEGHTNTAIAGRLGITRRGVERHINAIFAKLSLPDGGDVSRRVMATLLFLDGEGRLAD